jgi:hypothetical protein
MIKATETRRGSCIVPRVQFKPRAYYIKCTTTYRTLAGCSSALPTKAANNNSPFTFKQVSTND